MTPYFLMAAGAALVLAALALGLRRSRPWHTGLAMAGVLVVGAAELGAGAWPGVPASCLTAAYLAWQWNTALRKVRRR